MRFSSLVSRSVLSCGLLMAVAFGPRAAEAQSGSPLSQTIEQMLQFQAGNAAATTQATLPPNSAGSGFVVNADGGTVNVNSMQNNSFSNNVGSGMVLNANNGGAVNVASMTNNTHSGNGAAGMTIQANNGAVDLAGFSGNVLTGNAGAGISVDATNSTISANITQNIIGFEGLSNGGPGVSVTVNGGVLDLNVGGPAAGSGNQIDSNGGAGVLVQLNGDANANFSVQNNLITNTSTNAAVNGTNGSGIQVNRTSNSQMSGNVSGNLVTNNAGSGLNVTASGSTDPNAVPTLDVTGNTFEQNSGNGLSFSLIADAVLDADVTLNVISGNTLNGVSVSTANDSAFGVPAALNPLLGGSLFDGNLISGNLQNGVLLSTTNDSQLLAVFTSNLNTSEIFGNGGHGISLQTTGDGLAEVAVLGGLNLNSISGNGNFTTGVGSGILFNETSTGESTLLVSNVVIGGASAADGNAGAGITLNSSTVSNPTLLVDAALIQNNGSHGIDVLGTGTTNPVAFFTSGLTVSVTGGTQIVDNGGAGLNVLLQGAMGLDAPVNISVVGTPGAENVISGNGLEGIMMRTNPGTLTVAANGDTHHRVTIFGTPVPPGTATGQPVPPYDPSRPEFTNRFDYVFPYQTSQFETLVTLDVQDNLIQFNGNGSGGTRGDGMFIDVGTNSRVEATVLNNSFSGNLLSDFRTQSFVSGNQTPVSVNVNNPGNDTVFLDHTAQLSLLFDGNTGDQIDVSRSGTGSTAIYTNNDAGKNFFGPNSSTFRRATLFEVDLGTNSNSFVENGVPANVSGEFGSGVYDVTP